MATIPLLNIHIQNISQQNFLNELEGGVVVTPNVDHLVKLQSDYEFYQAYTQAEWVICDSRILQLLSKLTKFPISEAIPGSSFFPAFYTHHANNPNCRIFLLGAAPGVASKARSIINKKIGREIVIGAHSPSYGFEKNPREYEAIIDLINRSDATVVLVGVGAPKQEKWITKYRNKMPGVKIWLALGATIDFEAGNIKRAPKFMQKFALEWLYRIIQEPRRMSRRYLIEDPIFFFHFLQQLLGIYRNPFKKNNSLLQQ